MAKKIYSDTEIFGKLKLATANTGGGCYLQADANGDLCTLENGQEVKYLKQNDYKIGDIFLSTTNASPAMRFGGTWEQLKGDAYLKIVANGAGVYAGTSNNHTIPFQSMPSHTHTLKELRVNGSSGLKSDGSFPAGTYPDGSTAGGYNMAAVHFNAFKLNNAGGSASYYPYYYGIYVWIKVQM